MQSNIIKIKKKKKNLLPSFCLKQASNGNFTPGSAACIDAAVTPAIPAGASYHRTQASPLLAHCCCHSSAPPELLPTAPTTQTTAQTAQQRTHIHAHAQTNKTRTNTRKGNTKQERENHEGEIIMGKEKLNGHIDSLMKHNGLNRQECSL